MAAAAIERTVGLETIPHVTPRDCVGHGPPVPAPRRARRGDPERPRRHRRPAARRRLPGLERRLRRGRDRPHDAAPPPEPRGGLLRARRSTRRPRSTSAWPSTRPRRTSTARSSASGSKVDAGARFAMTQALFDLDVPRPLPRARSAGAADPAARRRLAADELPAGVPAPQRGARASRSRRRSSSGSPTRAPDARAVGFELARRARRGIADARGRDLRDSAVQGARCGPSSSCSHR